MAIVDWNYIDDGSNKSKNRFLLGQILDSSKRIFLWFGINPSTARPNKLDPTLTRVKNFSKSNNNNQEANWLMANIYPQRQTDPNLLHKTRNLQLHQENLKVIDEVLQKYNNITIVFA